MRKGKHPFKQPSNSEPPWSADSQNISKERAFLFTPTSARRVPTARDKTRNHGVRNLFDRIIPGLPIDSDPPETRQEPQPLSLIIEKTMKRLKIAESPWLNDLVQAWPTLVPPDVAAVTIPGKFDAGILYVYVTNSIKLFEIRRTGLKQMEKKVKTLVGDGRIRHVRLMVNSVPLPESRGP